MRVTFLKGDNRRVASWTAVRPDRSKVVGSCMAAGADLPHDLSTFVIEDALGLTDGFWGCVAAGATFASLGTKRTKRTEPGRAVIRAHRAGLDEAERAVGAEHLAWRQGHGGPHAEALDAMLATWRDVPPGGTLEITWSGGRARRPTASRSGSRR